MRTICKVLLDNLTLLSMAAGVVLLYVGVSSWSYPAANVTAGVLLVALALVPYLRRAE